MTDAHRDAREMLDNLHDAMSKHNKIKKRSFVRGCVSGRHLVAFIGTWLCRRRTVGLPNWHAQEPPPAGFVSFDACFSCGSNVQHYQEHMPSQKRATTATLHGRYLDSRKIKRCKTKATKTTVLLQHHTGNDDETNSIMDSLSLGINTHPEQNKVHDKDDDTNKLLHNHEAHHTRHIRAPVLTSSDIS